jgi:hypothetical protein
LSKKDYFWRIIGTSLLLYKQKMSNHLNEHRLLSFRITLLHFPRTSPGLPSPLRARAYREETALPGPDDDPTGWSSHKTGVILGKLFNTQTMEVEFVVRGGQGLCEAMFSDNVLSVSSLWQVQENTHEDTLSHYS